jgi:hypothetical protein
VLIYGIDGNLVTDFKSQTMYGNDLLDRSKGPESQGQPQYVIHFSASRKYLITALQRTKEVQQRNRQALECNPEDLLGLIDPEDEIVLNIIDLENCEHIGSLKPFSSKILGKRKPKEQQKIKELMR